MAASEAAPPTASAAGGASSAPPLQPGLYLVGTPIGNLEDITLRALRVLRTASCILAEDTRRTRILLERHGITTPLISCHKFNERAREEEILRRIHEGQALALVTDAGMPGISDPGARAASAVRRAGACVTAVSYTHLDVYKRQVKFSIYSSFLSPWVMILSTERPRSHHHP